MKILHVISSLNPINGGPVESVKNFCKYYKLFNEDVEIVCSDEPHDKWLKDPRLPKVHALGPVKFKYSLNFKLLKWFKNNIKKYDVLVINGIWQFHSFASWRYCKKNKIPYVLFLHGMLDPYFNKGNILKKIKKILYWFLIESKILRDAYRVLFTSKLERKLAYKSFSPYKINEYDLGYGVEGIPKSYNFKNNLFIKKYNLKNRKYLLYLGRLDKKKGLDLLIKSFAIINKIDKNLILVLAGSRNDYLTKNLMNLINDNSLKKNIVITGPIYGNLKWGALANCDVLCLTSHQENFGLVIAEALSCSKPVLITNKINIYDKINHYKAGLVCEDNFDAVTKMMKKYIRLNPKNYNTMCKQAKICFNENYKIEKTVYKLLNLLRKIV